MTKKKKNNNNRNKVNIPRNLSYAKIEFAGTDDFEGMWESIQYNNAKNKAILDKHSKENAVWLPFITNRWEPNITTNYSTGTVLHNDTYKTLFGNIGNKATNNSPLTIKNRNPEKEAYFLRRGVSTELLRHIIDEMRTAGKTIIMLHANTQGLEPYYEKFGFKPFPDRILRFMIDDPSNQNYYGAQMQDMYGRLVPGKFEGRVMYLELNKPKEAAEAAGGAAGGAGRA